MIFRKKLSDIGNDNSSNSKTKKQTEVKFYTISDIIKPERIFSEVNEGHLVFLNIGRINPYPDRKKKFLTSLKLCSSESQVTLRMISEDTVMVAPQTVPIKIRSLSPDDG